MFVNYGNVMIKKTHRQHGKVESIEDDANLDNKDYKKTLKSTWLPDTPKAPLVPTVEVDFDHLINKPVLDKEEDFKQFIGHQTWVYLCLSHFSCINPRSFPLVSYIVREE